MKATTEMEIKVSNGRILKAEVLPDGRCKLIIEADEVKAQNTSGLNPNFEKASTPQKTDEVKLKIPTEKPEVPKPEVKETKTEPKVEMPMAKVNPDIKGKKTEQVLTSMFVLVEASKLSLDDEIMNYQPQNDRERRFKEKLTQIIRTGPKDFYRPVCDPSINEKDEIYYKFGCEPAKAKEYKWWVSKAKAFAPDKGSRIGTISEYRAFLGVLMKKMLASGWTKEAVWKAVVYDSKEIGHYTT